MNDILKQRFIYCILGINKQTGFQQLKFVNLQKYTINKDYMILPTGFVTDISTKLYVYNDKLLISYQESKSVSSTKVIKQMGITFNDNKSITSTITEYGQLNDIKSNYNYAFNMGHCLKYQISNNVIKDCTDSFLYNVDLPQDSYVIGMIIPKQYDDFDVSLIVGYPYDISSLQNKLYDDYLMQIYNHIYDNNIYSDQVFYNFIYNIINLFLQLTNEQIYQQIKQNKISQTIILLSSIQSIRTFLYRYLNGDILIYGMTYQNKFNSLMTPYCNNTLYKNDTICSCQNSDKPLCINKDCIKYGYKTLDITDKISKCQPCTKCCVNDKLCGNDPLCINNTKCCNEGGQCTVSGKEDLCAYDNKCCIPCEYDPTICNTDSKCVKPKCWDQWGQCEIKGKEGLCKKDPLCCEGDCCTQGGQCKIKGKEQYCINDKSNCCESCEYDPTICNTDSKCVKPKCWDLGRQQCPIRYKENYCLNSKECCESCPFLGMDQYCLDSLECQQYIKCKELGGSCTVKDNNNCFSQCKYKGREQYREDDLDNCCQPCEYDPSICNTDSKCVKPKEQETDETKTTSRSTIIIIIIISLIVIIIVITIIYKKQKNQKVIHHKKMKQQKQ